MSELKPCPFCGKMPKVEPNGDCYCDYYICPMAPDSYMPKDWNARPIEDALTARIAELEAEKNIRKDQLREAKNILIDKKLQIDSLYEAGYKLQQRIAELEGIIKSDDERLTEAGLKVNLYFGCDTAEIMAEEILSSRARIAELEGLIDQLFEIGKGLDDGYEHYRFSEQTIPLMKLRKLTADWKEREA